jgi:DNA-binding NarL/FixJ family response regulator
MCGMLTRRIHDWQYNTRMLRVLIASPYPAMRAGLHVLLEETHRSQAAGGVTVVAEAGSVEAAVDWAQAAQPEVVLYDLAFEQGEALSGLWRLRAAAPGSTVVALCEGGSDGRVLAALQGGARGCLPKTATGAELVEALERAVQGEPALHPATTAALLQQLSGDGPSPALTPRETEVLRQVAAGQTNKAIALKIGISEHTVKFHLGSAMTKLGAASRAEAVASAIRRGLISV